ncbi:MAG: Holliday junction resolvase RuvX [Ignavibacteriaceae bacterium]|nr:Holliday junction resolvase RuvX [Ignavibacteriaceae bacterium]
MKLSENGEITGGERILAADFGHVRVGLALSDPMKIIASPLTTLKNSDGFLAELRKIIISEGVKTVVLGDPGEKPSNREIREKILKFKVQLESMGMEVVLWDETYTSEMAKQMVLETVKSRKKRQNKGLVDMNAAVIILQEYLRTV